MSPIRNDFGLYMISSRISLPASLVYASVQFILGSSNYATVFLSLTFGSFLLCSLWNATDLFSVTVSLETPFWLLWYERVDSALEDPSPISWPWKVLSLPSTSSIMFTSLFSYEILFVPSETRGILSDAACNCICYPILDPLVGVYKPWGDYKPLSAFSLIFYKLSISYFRFSECWSSAIEMS